MEVFLVRGTWSGVPEGGSDPVACTGVVEIVGVENLVPEGSKMCREGYSLGLGYLVERRRALSDFAYDGELVCMSHVKVFKHE